MAITGTFDADFSPFVREVDRGNAALRRFERGQKDVENASASSEARLRRTAKAIDEVDNVLNLFGVHLGPVKSAMNELANATSDAQSDMGALGVAVGVAGAAFAGWKVGRWIAELGGLDEKIGDTTAHLLGMKTAADEAAAANADAIQRAQGRIEGLTVLTAETAALINKLDAEEKIAANKAASDSEMRKTAYLKTQEALAAVNAEIKKIQDEGLVDQLTADINADALSAKDLAAAYGLSEAALAKFAAQAKSAAAIEANNAKQLQKIRDDMTAARVKREADEAAAAKKRVDDMYKDIEANWKDQEAWAAARDAEAIAQQERVRNAKAAEAALREERLEAERLARALGSTVDYDLSTAEGLKAFQRANPTATVTAPKDYFKTHSLAEGIAAGYVTYRGGGPAVATGAGGGTPRDYGSPPPPPAWWGAPATQTPPVYAPIYVSGVFDPTSAATLQKTVSQGLSRNVFSSRR